MPFLRRPRESEPLAVTMTGVRMGDRLLYVVGAPEGLASDVFDDVARKPGLSGRVAILSASENVTALAGSPALRRALERASLAADTLDLDSAASTGEPDGVFDLAVIDETRRAVAHERWRPVLDECRRLLRPGGRLAVIEPGRAGRLGLVGQKHGHGRQEAEVIAALTSAGLGAVRLLADAGGRRYFEAIRA